MNINPAIPNAPALVTDRPGFEYDPYGGAEQLMNLHAPTIPFHNYRQIHVSEIAFWKGYNQVQNGVPECPPLWGDISHYWYCVSYGGKLWYEFSNRDSLVVKGGLIVTLVSAYTALKTNGVI